jgi:tRNA U34 5-methylaminomethyl-2-thiouridine-forming methyltransferase MnmC
LNQIIKTSDGSHTIYVQELNEHYHSIYGAVQESTHIFIENGLETCKADPLNILEVGFGTGLNTLLTALKNLAGARVVNYTSIEKNPLSKEIISSLNHYLYAGENGVELFNSIHNSPWNEWVAISHNFNLKKIEADFIVESPSGNYDLIYFDAFGPDKQPEMWTKEVFTAISALTNKEGVFVTYSAKGEVRRNLTANGFTVSLLPGPPGKRQMIRAVKI